MQDLPGARSSIEPTKHECSRRAALAWIGGAALGIGVLTVPSSRTNAHSPNKFYQGALPYDFTALQGFLSAESVESHYRHHHRPFVDRANELLDLMAQARTESRFENLPAYGKALTESISGHVLHTIYWRSMSPFSGGEPSGDVASHVIEHFGTVDAFRSELRAMARAASASGWTVVAWEPNSGRILILNLDGDTGPFLVGSVPLLALDLHEHAYFPDFGHRRDDYIDKFIDLLDWDSLAVRLKQTH